MPIGSLGAGIKQEAFDRGMKWLPDVIAIDAESTDSGPAYLAKGVCKYNRDMIKNDLGIAIKGGMKAGIPVFVGSCGTCGTDIPVDECFEIACEIFREEGFQGKIARIYSEQQPETLKKKWNEGKIHALEGAPDITEETFGQCEHIVALMGAEPFIRAEGRTKVRRTKVP